MNIQSRKIHLLIATHTLGLAAAAAVAAPQPFADAVLADEPVLYYRLSEVAGDTQNLGSLGASFDGAIFGPTQRNIATAGGDGGVHFDDSNAFIESNAVVPASLLGNPDFTAETLVRIPAGAQAQFWPPFLHWGAPTTGQSVYFSLQFNTNNRIYAGFYNAGLMMSELVCYDTWLHVVWVRDSAEGTNDSEAGTVVYVNGTAVPLVRDPTLNPGFVANPTVTATTFRINRATDNVRYATIDMDELVLYDRPLAPAEVAEHWVAFADNVGDTDGDGVSDAVDNCVAVANADQRDSNADGFGNACDPDLNDDDVINFTDLGLMKSVFFSDDPDADLNGDGAVNFADLGTMKSAFFGNPGPSGTRSICGL
ncbi:MAG: LamG-like jellyroll fold domain-containing protein [Pseudomonadota bacterium]